MGHIELTRLVKKCLDELPDEHVFKTAFDYAVNHNCDVITRYMIMSDDYDLYFKAPNGIAQHFRISSSSLEYPTACLKVFDDLGTELRYFLLKNCDPKSISIIEPWDDAYKSLTADIVMPSVKEDALIGKLKIGPDPTPTGKSHMSIPDLFYAIEKEIKSRGDFEIDVVSLVDVLFKLGVIK